MKNNILKPIGDEKIVYQGKIVEVVRQKMKIGVIEKEFEFARRSPGTRLIIPTPQNKLIITREYRTELEDWDYRLPGGKVFDNLNEYNQFLKSGQDIIEAAKTGAIKEALEEVGIDVKELKYFDTSICGATIQWDLFYFIVENYTKVQQQTEYGENIEILELELDEIKNICLDGQMKEGRSVALLLRYLNTI